MCMWAIVVPVAMLTISEQRAVGIMGFRNIAMEPEKGPFLTASEAATLPKLMTVNSQN